MDEMIGKHENCKYRNDKSKTSIDCSTLIIWYFDKYETHKKRYEKCINRFLSIHPWSIQKHFEKTSKIMNFKTFNKLNDVEIQHLVYYQSGLGKLNKPERYIAYAIQNAL